MPAQIYPKFLFIGEWSQRSVSLRDTVSWKSEMSAAKDKKGTLFGRRPKATPNALERVDKLVGWLRIFWMWTLDLVSSGSSVKLTLNRWIHHFIAALESLNIGFCFAFWRPHGVVHTGHILFTFIVSVLSFFFAHSCCFFSTSRHEHPGFYRVKLVETNKNGLFNTCSTSNCVTNHGTLFHSR